MATYFELITRRLCTAIGLGASLSLLVALGASAAEPTTVKEGGRQRNNLVVELRLAELARNIASVQIEVRAADLKEPVKAEIRRSGDNLSGNVFVPPGKAREIRVDGFGEKGQLLYQGIAVADIAADKPVSVVVPLVSREGGELLAVTLASYAIKVEQTPNPKGGSRLRATVLDANGNVVRLTPDDYNWGWYGPPSLDPRWQVPPRGPEIPIPPPKDQTATLVPLCAQTTTVTICARGVCRPIKICADPVVAVSAGESHTCALTQAGAVFCWGDNTDGQLGSPQLVGCGFQSSEPSCSPAPTRVVCPAGSPCTFKQISAGHRHTCAVDTNGAVWCWGSNSSNQLAAPSAVTSSVTHIRSLAAGARAVAAGDGFTCAIATTTGTQPRVLCWGANDLGQSGQPLTANSSEQYPGPTIVYGPVKPVAAPTQVMAFPPNKLIVAGRRHVCVVTTDGWMRCWGDNNKQQVGNQLPIVVAPITGTPFAGTGTCGTCTITQVTVAGALFAGGLGSPLDVAGAGGETTCASFTGGSTTCWGSHPVGLPSAVTVRSIDAGTDHVCAVTGTGTLCWGRGDWGQLGHGVVGNLITPFLVPTPVTVLTTSTFTQVSTGGAHTCAITTGGNVSCWGRNAEGQLGTGQFGGQVGTPVPSLL